jgi:predicted O-methyltransferase YrrM
MNRVKQLIEETMATDPPLTGIAFLDQMHRFSYKLIGHWTPYYLLFYKLTAKLKPSFVVELGAWRGFGSAHFSLGNPDTHVTMVDIHKDEPQAGDHAHCLKLAGNVANLGFIHAWTWDAAPVIAQQGGQIDILYIDAWHRKDLVEREWDLYTPLLAKHALIVMDDIMNAAGASENMLEFWDEIDPRLDKFIDTRPHCGIPMGFVEWKK